MVQVLKDVPDPLLVLLEADGELAKALGNGEDSAWADAIQELRSRPVNRKILKQRDDYLDRPEPIDCTCCQPGTAEKIEVLAGRWQSGQSLWHPFDPIDLSGCQLVPFGNYRNTVARVEPSR